MALENRRKRHIQSSIASYFPSLPDSHCTSTVLERPPRLAVPILPDQIQASLLNVGMRVRKAVPEGYQTKKVFNVPFTDASPDTGSPGTTVQPRASTGSAAELQPFCGIHKIGGYDTQEAWLTCPMGASNGGLDTSASEKLIDAVIPSTYFSSNDNDIPFFSSQSSTASVTTRKAVSERNMVTLPLRGRKRVRVDDEENENKNENQNARLDCLRGAEDTIRGDNYLRPHRLIANARRRGQGGTKVLGELQLHDVNFGSSIIDFDEAEFLSRDEEHMDLDAL